MKILNVLAPFKQQTIGVIRLSIPLILVGCFYPIILASVTGKIMCSLALAAYILYLHYIQTKNHRNALLFSPSGECKDILEKAIRTCGLDPQGFAIRSI